MASLTPALTLAPADYATRERPLPDGPAAGSAAWKDYWRECLSDSGLVGLTPLPVGYALVALRDLTSPNDLRVILRELLHGATGENLDEIGPPVSGYVLSYEGSILAPGCCGDLSNLRDWEAAAAHENEDWATVWIGHPWTHVRARGDVLHFAEPSETTPPRDAEEALRIPRRVLLELVESAREERRAFGERLLPLIEEVAPRGAATSVLEVLLMGHPSLCEPSRPRP